MSHSRAYVPSIAVLRALSRPVTSRCTTAHRLHIHHVRGKRTKAKQSQQQEEPEKMVADFLLKNMHRIDKDVKPWENAHKFKHVERDAAGNERETPIPKTQEEYDRIQRQMKLIEKTQDMDAEHLPSELKLAIHDEMMQDPAFAPFRGVMEKMHEENMKTKEQKAKEAEEHDAQWAKEQKEADANNAIAVHQYFQELIDDPQLAALRDEMIQYQSKIPEWNFEGKEFHDTTDRLIEKLEKIPAFQKRLAKEKMDWEADEKEGKLPHQILDVDDVIEEDALLKRIEGGDEAALDELYQKSLARLRKVNPDKADEIERLAQGDSMDGPEEQQVRALEQLTEQLSSLKDAPSSEELEEMEKDPQMQALVDKYLDDPDLMQTLSSLKMALEEVQGNGAMQSRTRTGAPDPDTLPASELATLKERYQQAQNDPEHVSALRRLRINLLPPFHLHPAVKQLNQILRFAYFGANDDVRRILWRAYNKARTVPTLLQNIPDDAWDMLYYSQAVTWKSNQNRDDHLSLILEDLHSIGRDGPPTHPDTFAEEQ